MWGWRPEDRGGLGSGGWVGELLKKLSWQDLYGVSPPHGVTSVSHKHTFTRSPREKVPVMGWSLELVVKGGA